MNALETLLREMILHDGPISLDRFMTLALAHPEHGAYTSRVPLGKEGDFITAPEISQMFGELIGLWAVEVWYGMGCPAPFRLVELGPGRGTLMADALRAVKVAPDFGAALDLHLVETSEILRRDQARALEPSGVAAHWHAAVEDVPAGPIIAIANEFFDCLPVRHYVSDAGFWRERLIGLDSEGRLAFGLAPEPELGLGAATEAASILEIGIAATRSMREIAGRIAAEAGALLAIDYGYDGASGGETLQALRHHRFVDPLRAPGEADLTAHVDFAALRRAAQAAGADVHGPVPLGEWLTRLGICERAAALRKRADVVQTAEIDSALARLTGYGSATKDPRSMSELFKVLVVTASGAPIPPGFTRGEGA
jgi:NADH dehydrogenase [ubiquinone] 1 alpha subcomplex assembly factor 7